MKRTILSLVFFGVCLICTGQSMSRAQYIEKYKEIAIRQMERCGIPASITLAQGCLESGNGNSRLAVEGKNHFGIKCHNWDGKSISVDDDEKNECFRKYNSAEESFEDHSDFLRYGKRYSFLFELEKDDYRGWAYGLKKAGYATNPLYAESLIRIIEENQLYLFDKQATDVPPTPRSVSEPRKATPKKGSPAYRISLTRNVLSQNGISYIIADGRDTWSSIANEYDLFKRELLSFNDLKRETTLNRGDRVYIEKKRRRGAKWLDAHVVEEGETLYDISQEYAIQLKYLYKYNNLPQGCEPAAGTLIKFRKK